MTSAPSPPTALYWQYLSGFYPNLPPEVLASFPTCWEQTVWDDPQTPLDCNNLAVIALIEAEQAEGDLRAMGLEMALVALMQGVEMEPGHPLCVAHLALVRSLIGESEAAFQTAFPALIDLLQFAYTGEVFPLGLIYWPQSDYHLLADPTTIESIFAAATGTDQAMRLFAAVLCHCQLVFYGVSGKRFLQLAAQLMPNSARFNLTLGLAHLMQQQWEGLLYLHQARTIAPEFAPAVQALYLAYRPLQPEVADFWLQHARELAEAQPQSLDWRWTSLDANSAFTYLPFERTLLMAVEPNLRSIVTSVLLAEADWFEAEMEFLREQLQPGMVVIDVGANVGVYTFSAAQKVGSNGRVLAVEPFSGCIRCLQETQRLNQLDWVTVCAGAASDHHGTSYLSLQAASELNEVISEIDPTLGEAFEAITCFPLDSLIDSEGINRLDWLKIDAEGHEMQVLAGSDRLLAEFAPGIIYENIAGDKGSNTEVAAYLQIKGYRLFRYQPYLKNLIPVESLEQLQGNLNIIALPNQSG
ncbi:FkbM family methyltransferase [Leptolyngbya sp. 7M]|uniref:FkbM family methyltransferase n=1 Tax=Leptolyngbya sp. 7M TaxID=2812896 RepID=UPI001B8D4DB4|nr:FkbM family methyltransferase [Leptolyngbya sp. 7M]QYO61959.1 FkbM family methyltransferase [Leptolyngbya sp. 7M]